MNDQLDQMQDAMDMQGFDDLMPAPTVEAPAAPADAGSEVDDTTGLKAADGQTPAVVEPQATPPQVAPAEGEAPAPGPAMNPTPAATPEGQKTEAQLAATMAQLAEAVKGLQTPKEIPKPKAEEAPQEAAVPAYMFNVREDLVNSLRSEDPKEFAGGLQMLIASIGQAVHKTVRGEFEQTLKTRLEEFKPSVITEAHVMQQRTTAQKEVEKDFYGTYPMLAKPELRPMVLATAVRLQQSNPQFADGRWTPEFRDAIGKAVLGLFQTAATQGQPAAQPQPSVAQKAPKMVPTTASRPVGPAKDQVAEFRSAFDI